MDLTHIDHTSVEDRSKRLPGANYSQTSGSYNIINNTSRNWLAMLLTLVVAMAGVAEHQANAKRPPNIVYILADDLGYAELGSYGQTKIKTPHLDQLAAEGMQFTQHYCGNAVCAPSRCVLMTGKHPGHAYVRNNRQGRLSEAVQKKYGMEFRGQEPIPDSEVTIAEILKKKGYATAAIGKWGLGHFGTTGDPNRQGFDLFFGYNCQAHAHSFYPAYLWRNGRKVPLKNNPPVPGHASLAEGADPSDPNSYAPFKGTDYSADHMLDEAIQFIRDNKEDPFFLYFPSTIPHVALHVPDEELEQYLGKWEEKPFTRATGYGYTPHMTPRAAYAAMISRLDKDVGKLMELLKEIGLDEDTLVMFSSDNGTTHLDQEVDFRFFESVGPLRGLKGSLYEGGIRVPMIVRWPGKIKPGTSTDLLSAFWDVMPTLAEIAGCEPPADTDGISFLPTLLGRPGQKRHDFLYWEFGGYGGQQAVRMDDWKAVRQNLLRKSNLNPLKIELYNLRDDISESRDVAIKYPEIVARLRKIMATERTPSTIFKLPPLDHD